MAADGDAIGAEAAPPAPLIVLSDEEQARAMAAASSDLRFLFDREQVDPDVQKHIFHVGVLTVRQFAAFAKDAEDLREIFRTGGLGIDPTGPLQERVKMSRVLVAWESAKTRATRVAEKEGESEVRQEPRQLRSSDYLGTKEGFEARWWELDNKRTPAKVYVEKILAAVE